MIKAISRVWLVILVFVLLAPFAYGSDVNIGANKEILVDGKPFFPIMVWVNPSHLFDFNIALGINTFVGQGGQPEEPKAYLDACKVKNVLGCICVYDGKVDMASLKDHPSLLFWWLPDEPDIFGKKTDGTSGSPRLLPEEVKKMYDNSKAGDSTHPVMLNFAGGGPISTKIYAEFAKYADGIGYDVYPCNAGTPEKLYLYAKYFRELTKYDKGTKPHFAWVECSFFGAEGGKVPGSKARAPNAAELKAEVWMCIVNGAKMIGYFGHSWSPEYWWARIPDDLQAEMKKINKNITDLSAVILAKDSDKKVEVEETDKTQIGTLVKEASGKIYVFTSNMRSGEGKVKFTVPVAKGTAEVYDEGRKLEINGGKFEDNFKSFEPHIYVINN